MAAKSRLCSNAGARVYEGSGPTVLDALAAVVDDLARRGDLNQQILGVYTWDDPEWRQDGDDRIVIVTVSD